MRFKGLDILALVLIIIGAINWGLIGIFNYDLIASMFGGQLSTISRVIYTVVCLAGIWAITFLFRKNNYKEVH